MNLIRAIWTACVAFWMPGLFLEDGTPIETKGDTT